VKFNDVTWNVTISGFANMQMLSETATALKKMEQENWSIDAYTLKGVQRLNELARLREVIDGLDTNWEGVNESDRAL